MVEAFTAVTSKARVRYDRAGCRIRSRWMKLGNTPTERAGRCRPARRCRLARRCRPARNYSAVRDSQEQSIYCKSLRGTDAENRRIQTSSCHTARTIGRLATGRAGRGIGAAGQPGRSGPRLPPCLPAMFAGHRAGQGGSRLRGLPSRFGSSPGTLQRLCHAAAPSGLARLRPLPRLPNGPVSVFSSSGVRPLPGPVAGCRAQDEACAGRNTHPDDGPAIGRTGSGRRCAGKRRRRGRRGPSASGWIERHGWNAGRSAATPERLADDGGR